MTVDDLMENIGNDERTKCCIAVAETLRNPDPDEDGIDPLSFWMASFAITCYEEGYNHAKDVR